VIFQALPNVEFSIVQITFASLILKCFTTVQIMLIDFLPVTSSLYSVTTGWQFEGRLYLKNGLFTIQAQSRYGLFRPTVT